MLSLTVRATAGASSLAIFVLVFYYFVESANQNEVQKYQSIRILEVFRRWSYAVAAAGSFWLVSIALCRLYLHPLSWCPGPFWARITNFHSVYHCYIGDRHLDLHRLHLKHGDFVRYGPDRISVRNSDAFHEIYSVRANVNKGTFYTTMAELFGGSMLMTTIDKKEHATKRRIHTRALTETITELEPVVIGLIDRFCNLMVDKGKPNDAWSGPRDMSRWFGYLTNDIAGEITFNKQWNMLEDETHRPLVDILAEGVLGLDIVGQMPILLRSGIANLIFGRIMRNMDHFLDLSQKRTDWRLAQKNLPHRDLFTGLTEAEDGITGYQFSDEELMAEAGLLIIAASDTSATTLASTLFYLLKTPSTLETLQRQIRLLFPSLDAVVPTPGLLDHDYLHGCVMEAMRMSPGATGVLPRHVDTGGMSILDRFFPENTILSTPTYALHHDERYYPDPYTFRPERWIIDSVDDVMEKNTKKATEAFAAFSVGRTSCIGQPVAFTVVKVTLARLLWQFDMELADVPPEVRQDSGSASNKWRNRREFQIWDRFIGTHEGPVIKFRPREVEKSS